jgi:hypothetical protein
MAALCGVGRGGRLSNLFRTIGLVSRDCVGGGGGLGRAGLWGQNFPHFAPPHLTCGFVATIFMTTMFGLVLVEECGVQWGAVE